jgi:hypothetical protein
MGVAGLPEIKQSRPPCYGGQTRQIDSFFVFFERLVLIHSDDL